MPSSASSLTFSSSESSESSSFEESQSPEHVVTSMNRSDDEPLAIARRKLLEAHPHLRSVCVPTPSLRPEQNQPAERTPLPSSRPQPSPARTPLSTLRPQPSPSRSPLATSRPALPQQGHFPSPRRALPTSRPDTSQEQHQPHQQDTQPQETLVAPPFACLPGTLAPPAAIAALTSATPEISLTNPIFPIPTTSLTPAVFSTTLTRAQRRLFSDATDPHGYPRFLPLGTLIAETDPGTFRACDCIVTLLWLYSPRLANDFFAANGAEHGATLEVFDNRVQPHWLPRQTEGGARQVPQWGVWKINDEVTIGFRTQSSKKMCRYIARIADDIGLWAGVDAKDEAVSVGPEDEERVERFGAIIGRELLNTRFWYRQPYYTVKIEVDGAKVTYA